MSDERLCINCKHYRDPERWSSRPANCVALKGRPNPVLGGDIESVEVSVMRMSLCGWTDPRLFERRDK